MLPSIWLCITVWFAMGIPPSIEVALIKKQQGAYLPIECSLTSDISFKFTNKQSNKTQTIAACSININSCYLSDKILAQSYAIAKSEVGGVLFIIDVSDDTFGTYTCYETYNASKSANVDVSVADLEMPTSSTTCKNLRRMYSSFIGLLFDGIQTLLLIVCIACIIFRVNCKSFYIERHNSKCKGPQLKNIEDNTGSLFSDSSSNEDVEVKTGKADTIRYDKELDSLRLHSAADPHPKTTCTTAYTPMFTQPRSVSVATDPLIHERSKYTTTETASFRSPGHRSKRPLAGMPSSRYNSRSNVF